jgi:hypothetical protein
VYKLKDTTMTTTEKYQAAYNEAKEVCIAYKDFKGDKRSSTYKRLSIAVVDIYMGRMTSFGKKLCLPTFKEYFYPELN